TGGWTGVVVYTIFGLATLLSPLADLSSSPGEEGLDLFVLAAACAGVANGLVLLVTPGPPVGPFSDVVGSARAWNGLLFLVGGSGVLVTRLRSQGPRLRFWRGLTQAALGVAFLTWLLSSAIPALVWTGILFYGGVAGLLLFGPWLGKHVQRL